MTDNLSLNFTVTLTLREFDFVRAHASLHAVTIDQAMAMIVTESIGVGMAQADQQFMAPLTGSSMDLPPSHTDAPLTSSDTLTLRDNGGDLGPLLRH